MCGILIYSGYIPNLPSYKDRLQHTRDCRPSPYSKVTAVTYHGKGRAHNQRWRLCEQRCSEADPSSGDGNGGDGVASNGDGDGATAIVPGMNALEMWQQPESLPRRCAPCSPQDGENTMMVTAGGGAVVSDVYEASYVLRGGTTHAYESRYLPSML